MTPTLLTFAPLNLMLCAANRDDSNFGGPPSGSPPPATPPGGRGSGSSPMKALLDSFSQAAASTKVASLSASLISVVSAHQTLGALGSKTDDVEADRAVETMTTSLAAFTGNDMDFIASASWTLVASALFVAGQVILWRGENESSGERSSELLHAASDFAAYAYGSPEARRGVAHESLFLHDRYLADTILSLKGWLPTENSHQDRTDFRETLGATLVRTGIESGVKHWTSGGLELPNLSAALWTFFDGSPLSTFYPARLLRPYSYFEAAAAWRPDSLGYQELVLASLLDGHPLSRTLAIAEDSLKMHDGDKALSQIHRSLMNAVADRRGRWETAKELAFELAPEMIFAEQMAPNLPAFLKTAFEPIH